MAGGFGGDDEEYQNYSPEEDEEVDPEEGEEEESEEGEEDESEEDEEDGGDEERPDQEKQNAIKKKLMEIEERRLTPKLQQLPGKIQSRTLPFLNPLEKRNVEKAKKHKKLKPQLIAIEMALMSKRVQFAAKLKSMISSAIGSLGPIMPYILVGLCVVVIIGSVFMGLSMALNGAGGGGGSNDAAFGVKGSDFYGVRTIYKDDEKARAALLEDYSTIIKNTVDNIETISTSTTVTENVGGEDKTITYTISVDVTYNFPVGEDDEDGNPTDYDYSEFDETEFQASYADHYALLNEIAKVVYSADNGGATAPATLSETLDGILYFGIDDTLSTDIDTALNTAIATKYQIVVWNVTDDKDATSEKADLINANKATLEGQIPTKITESLTGYTTRAEKLFIKDFVFASSDDMMKGIEKLNYVAWIFMPKRNVTFTKLSFTISHTDIDNFTITAINNGSEISLKKDDTNWSDMGEYTPEDLEPSYSYIAENISVAASTYADIDTSNLGALANDVSLAEILNDTNITSETYLQTNEDGYYTYKCNGVYVEFTSDVAFVCKEIETLWN